MEEIMQINVLKLFKTAIIQLSNRNQFFKDNSQSDETSILIETELKTLKDELIAINLEVTRFSSVNNTINQFLIKFLVKIFFFSEVIRITSGSTSFGQNLYKSFRRTNEREWWKKFRQLKRIGATNEKMWGPDVRGDKWKKKIYNG